MIDRDSFENLSHAETTAFTEGHIKESQWVSTLRAKADKSDVPVVSKAIGNFLCLLVRMKQPKRILEIGTGYGLSAWLMMEAGGEALRIDSIEINPPRHAFATKLFTDSPFANRVHLIVGDVREENFFSEWQARYDIIFIDAAKGQYEKITEACLPLLHADGCIILADVLLRGWVITGNYPTHRRKTAVLRMQNYLEKLKEDKRFHFHFYAIEEGVVVLTLRSGKESLWNY